MMERTMKEQDKVLEKNRRKAFWGLQLKYTLAPILWLYGSVFVILTGLFLINFTKVAEIEGEILLFEQLKALPLDIAFFALVMGSQTILKVGFERQKKNEPALKRLLLPKETTGLIRLCYSLFVTLGAFMVFFIMLCFLLLLENILAPESAYGGAELYPVFYQNAFLFRVYPVASAGAIPGLINCVALVSVLSLPIETEFDFAVWGEIAWRVLAGVAFIFYCFIEVDLPVWDFTVMAICWVTYVGKVVIAYWRRQKDDRAEALERME